MVVRTMTSRVRTPSASGGATAWSRTVVGDPRPAGRHGRELKRAGDLWQTRHAGASSRAGDGFDTHNLPSVGPRCRAGTRGTPWLDANGEAIAGSLVSTITFPQRRNPMPSRFAGTVRAPEFPEGLDWINSEPLTLSQLRGKLVLLDFWTYC